MIIEDAEPRMEFRWLQPPSMDIDRVLQQKWTITRKHTWGEVIDIQMEWRDVPTVIARNET